MITLRRLLILLLLTAPLTLAATPSFDFSGSIQGLTDDLVLNYLPLLKPIGDDVFVTLTIIMIMLRGASMLTSTSHHEYQGEVVKFKGFVKTWLVTWVIMAGYDTPMFGTGLSIHQAIPAGAVYIASQINLSILDTMLADIKAIISGMPAPGVLAPIEMGVFAFVMFQAVILEGILVLVSSFGFVAIGVLSLLGPVLICWNILPAGSFLFYGWLHGTIKYSLYIVVAAAQAWLWASVADKFFITSIAGDYSLTHLLGCMVGLGVVTLGTGLGLLSTSALTNDIISGSAHAGGSGMGVVAAIKGFL